MTATELKAKRKQLKLTQEGLADMLSVKKRTITAWETEQNPIPSWVDKRLNEEPKKTINPKVRLSTHSDLQKIAQQRGVSLDDIIAVALETFVKNTLGSGN